MKNKENLIKCNLSIKNAMELINNAKFKIAIVVDENKKILGTITDGDIRRCLIKEINLETNVKKILNKNPIVVLEKDLSIKKNINLFDKKKIILLPVVNKNNIVVDLISKDDLLFKEKNLIFLMAGGYGKRLQPLTNTVPKPMLKVGKKPILEIIIESFKNQGFFNFYIVVHYKKEIIKEYFKSGEHLNVEINYLEENKMLGSIGGINLIKKKPKNPFFVMNSDIICDVNFLDLLKFHIKNSAKATMVVVKKSVKINYGQVSIKNGKISKIKEKPTNEYLINAGLYVFEPDVFRLIRNNENISAVDLFNKLLSKKKKCVTYLSNDNWIDIGKIEDFNVANNLLKEK